MAPACMQGPAGPPRDLMLIPHPHSRPRELGASSARARIGEGAGGPCCNHGPRFETGHLIIVARMSGAISGISLPFRADPVLFNPAPTQAGIRVTNPSTRSYYSLSLPLAANRARAGRPARSVFQDTMIVSRGEAWIRKVDGCSLLPARSLLLLHNMGLDRGRRSVRHPHTRMRHDTSSFSSSPVLATPLAFQSRQSFAPSASLTARPPFWSCSRPDRSAPFTRPFPPPVSIAPA